MTWVILQAVLAQLIHRWKRGHGECSAQIGESGANTVFKRKWSANNVWDVPYLGGIRAHMGEWERRMTGYVHCWQSATFLNNTPGRPIFPNAATPGLKAHTTNKPTHAKRSCVCICALSD